MTSVNKDTLILERGGATRLLYFAIGSFFIVLTVVFLVIGSASARGVTESKLINKPVQNLPVQNVVQEVEYEPINNDLLEWSLSQRRRR